MKTDNKQKLRVGIIGSGPIGGVQSVLLNFHPQAELTAVCEPDKEQFHSLQNIGMAENLYPDTKSFFADQEVDAVWICGPPSSHLSIVQETIPHGVQIFISPPLAESFVSAKKMLQLAEEASLNHGTGYHHPFQRMFQEAKKYLASNILGDIKRVRGSIHWSLIVSGKDRDSNIPINKDGGLILHSGGSLFMLLHWLLGPAKSLHAQISPFDVPNPEGSTILLDYPGGILSHLDISWRRPGYPQQTVLLTIEGTRGIMEVCSDHLKVFLHQKTSRFDSGWTCFSPADFQSNSPFFYYEEGYYECTADFIESCLAGHKPVIGWTEAKEVMKMVEAVSRSVRHNKTINLDEVE
ncbi:Gfo/Idh/MocA family protein [Acidobacteriota bacterium]